MKMSNYVNQQPNEQKCKDTNLTGTCTEIYIYVASLYFQIVKLVYVS